MAMNNLGHKIFKGFQDVVSKIKPTMKESKFYEEGKLTPEEYVLAGDYLVKKCPTWKWCSAKKEYYNKSLPEDKQYLLTRVRSKFRASDYLKSNNTKEKIIEGDWVDADLENKPKTENKKGGDIDLDALEKKEKKKVEVAEVKNDDDDFVIEGEEEPKQEEKKETKKADDFEIVDEDDCKEKDQAGVLKTREYEVTVTYDFYYCVPRMWLMGYNEKGIPLTDEEMKEDIMPEYRNKTCTIEPQTFTGIRNISVHPCRHSLLLKKMIKDFQNSGKKLEVEQSILLFLKFLQSVVPTVQYDFTMDISF
jgi:ubiquitin-like-conjugating enzyme ATG3